MMGATRTCPADGCTTQIPRRLALCRPHWRMVPAPIRARVLHLYREAPGSAEHLQALEDATAAASGREPEDLFG